MTYTSNESGRNEIYVRRFPSGEQPKKISVAGGDDPRWRSDGKELYFMGADGRMMAVPTKIGTGTNPSFEPGAPQMLFEAPMLAHYGGSVGAYDVTPDGKRFLLTTVADVAGASTVLDVVVNWDKLHP
jgi:Tol biopolymer transport system component